MPISKDEMRLSLRHAIGLLLAVAALLLGVAALGGHSSSPPVAKPHAAVHRTAARGPKPVTVPIQVRFNQDNAIGSRPMIAVQVGNGPKVPVLLDTGSTGLHIYAPGVGLGPGGGVTVSSTPNKIDYLDGTVQSGVVAKAKLTIGSRRTRTAVPFGLINSVGCQSAIPDCPGSIGLSGYVAEHIYGIMGVGMAGDQAALANPLMALAGGYGHRWSIELSGSRGRLVLGAPAPQNPLAQFHLRADGHDPTGVRRWDDLNTRVCWAAVGLRGDACVGTVFDTGSSLMGWFGGLLSHANTETGYGVIAPGTFVAAWQPGAQKPFWTFTAGMQLSNDTVIPFSVGKHKPFVVAAVASFFKFTITYDSVHGTISLARQ